MHGRTWRAAVAGAIASAALVATASAADDTHAALREWHHALELACERGDGAAAAALFTEDATIIEPQRPAARGRQAIGESFAYAFEYGLVGCGSHTDDIFTDGETAVEVGGELCRFRDGTTARSRFMILFRNVDGRWLAQRAVVNAEP